MGETYVIANLDRKEFINPFHLGDGGKLNEFVLREDGPTNVAVALLLAKRPKLPNGSLVGGRAGSWYGNRIAVVGLYENPLPDRKENFYEVITGMGSEGYANISVVVLEMVLTYLAAFDPPRAP